MTCFIKFDVHTDTWVTHRADPDDDWSYDSTDGSVYIQGATIASKDSYDTLPCKDEVSVGDTVYLAYAVYGTGDSFGSTGGKYELLSVHKSSQEAEDSRKHYAALDDYSVPWIGYFEWLQGIYVVALKVQA